MPDEAGFQIGKRLYPFPSRFRLGDTVLIEKVTDLTWPEFVERLPSDDEDAPDDPIAMLGLLAISVSQEHPSWRRDRVVRFVSDLGMEDVQFVGPQIEEDTPDDEQQEKAPGDADPQQEGANGATASSTPAPLSKSESAARSEESSPTPSGT